MNTTSNCLGIENVIIMYYLHDTIPNYSICINLKCTSLWLDYYHT